MFNCFISDMKKKKKNPIYVKISMYNIFNVPIMQLIQRGKEQDNYLYNIFQSKEQMNSNTSKRTFCYVRVAKIQFGLRIRAVWSESSLGAFWRAKGANFFIRTTKTLIRLRGCAGWSESSLGANVRRYVFSLCGSNDMAFFTSKKHSFTAVSLCFEVWHVFQKK